MRRSVPNKTKPNHLKRGSQKKRTRRAVSKLPKTRRRRNANAKINTGITNAALDEKVYSMRLRGGGKEEKKKTTSTPGKKPHGAKGASDETHLKVPVARVTTEFAILCHGANAITAAREAAVFTVPEDVIVRFYSTPGEVAEIERDGRPISERAREFTKRMCYGRMQWIQQFEDGELCPDHILVERLGDIFSQRTGILFCDTPAEAMASGDDLRLYAPISGRMSLSSIVNQMRRDRSFDRMRLIINCFFCRNGRLKNRKDAQLDTAGAVLTDEELMRLYMTGEAAPAVAAAAADDDHAAGTTANVNRIVAQRRWERTGETIEPNRPRTPVPDDAETQEY